MVFGESLAKPEGKGHFAIRKTAKDLASAPLPGRRALLQTLWPQRINQSCKLFGCSRDRFEWIPIS